MRNTSNFYVRNNSSRRKPPVFFSIVFTLVALFIVGGVGFSIYSQTKTQSHTACEITHTDRTRLQEGGSDIRVYTSNCGTFRVGDSLFDGQFNSADLYGRLANGGTWDFDTRGIRMPFFSSFENIVEARPSVQ